MLLVFQKHVRNWLRNVENGMISAKEQLIVETAKSINPAIMENVWMYHGVEMAHVIKMKIVQIVWTTVDALNF